MASPHVAGAVALLLEARPRRQPAGDRAAAAEHRAAALWWGNPGARLPRQRPSPGRGHAADRRRGRRPTRSSRRAASRSARSRPAPSRSGCASRSTMRTSHRDHHHWATHTRRARPRRRRSGHLHADPRAGAGDRREHVHAVVPHRFRDGDVQRADRHARRPATATTTTTARRRHDHAAGRRSGVAAVRRLHRLHARRRRQPCCAFPTAGTTATTRRSWSLTPTAAGFPWLAKLVGSSLFNQPNGATFTLQGDDVPYLPGSPRSSVADAEAGGHRSCDRRIGRLRRHRGVPAAQQLGDVVFRVHLGRDRRCDAPAASCGRCRMALTESS